MGQRAPKSKSRWDRISTKDYLVGDKDERIPTIDDYYQGGHRGVRGELLPNDYNMGGYYDEENDDE